MNPVTPVKVAVLDDYQDAARRYAPWQDLGAAIDLTVFRDHLHDEAAVIARLQPFQVVCMMRERTPLPPRVLDALPNLKLVITTGMWNAVLAVEHARARGITVCGTQSMQSGTPELTWLLLLALARHYDAERASVRAGGWQTGVGMDLRKRTLGLLGLGTIGTRVAKVANAFGMEVLAWSQNLTDERAAEAGARRVDKATLLAESDFVSLHLKLSERTHHVIGAAELARMKRSAYLLNTSRGPLVDEAALVAALRERTIAGAGLDVFDVEPLPGDHPFWRHPNIRITPHIAGQTNPRTAAPGVADNIRRLRAGQPLHDLIDRDAGY